MNGRPQLRGYADEGILVVVIEAKVLRALDVENSEKLIAENDWNGELAPRFRKTRQWDCRLQLSCQAFTFRAITHGPAVAVLSGHVGDPNWNLLLRSDTDDAAPHGDFRSDAGLAVALTRDCIQ